MSSFFQTPPKLTNTFASDHSLQLHLRRLLDPSTHAAILPELRSMGARAAGEMIPLSEEAERNPPTLTHYDAYGRRIDRIELSHGWKAISRIAAETGIVAIPHEQTYGWMSRVFQFAMLNLFGPSSAYVSCPLAMSDGATAALKAYGEGTWAERAVQHLTSRNPDEAWTSGQWMTEKEGGSDVSRSSTVARFDGTHWRLYGTKYFTSATTSQCTLGLARPEGADAGSRGLSLFYVEPWNADGSANNIRVRRLKDKLGTRALPTAELELDGCIAQQVGELRGGLRKISTVLNIARYFNAVSAVSWMRRGLDLSIAYAKVREAFGSPLIRLPLHLETLASMQVEYDAALAVGVRLAELLGKVEASVATEHEHGVWRLLTPLAKLGTGKQTVASASETLEAFGGAGYVEDTGVPRILRDAQVLPIWEGTTNVLSLDVLRAIHREDALQPFLRDIKDLVSKLDETPLASCATEVLKAHATLGRFAQTLSKTSTAHVQNAARSFALSLYRTYAAALLCDSARWEAAHEPTRRLTIAAQRWISSKPLVHLIQADDQRLADSASLLCM